MSSSSTFTSSTVSLPPLFAVAAAQLAKHQQSKEHTTTTTTTTPTTTTVAGERVQEQSSLPLSLSQGKNKKRKRDTQTQAGQPDSIIAEDEIIFFRCPTDENAIAIFNLPTGPFEHKLYEKWLHPSTCPLDATASKESTSSSSSSSLSSDSLSNVCVNESNASSTAITTSSSSSNHTNKSHPSNFSLSDPLFRQHHLNQLEHILTLICRQFGCVHELDVKYAEGHTQNDTSGHRCWCFVRYYSVNEANYAKRSLNKLKLGSCTLHAKPLRRSSGVTSTIVYSLAYHRCIDLLNHFLGYNQWNVSIVGVRPYDFRKDAAIETLYQGEESANSMINLSKKEGFKNSWTALVEFSVGEHRLRCEGVGHADASERSTRAKKRAVTNAFRGLFEQVAIVRVKGSNKAGIIILPTKSEKSSEPTTG